MPEMTLPEGVLRHVNFDQVEFDLAVDARYVLVLKYCTGETTTKVLTSRVKLYQAYSHNIVHLIQQEEIGGGEHPAHITWVGAFSFAPDNTGILLGVPVSYPQSDQIRDDCSEKHHAA